MEKIKNFTDLIAWKEAHNLVLFVYETTKKFPREESFGLTNQTRRAVISVTSNIAEGFGRRTAKDKSNFYTMASTSLAELQNQMLAARDLRYITKEEFAQFAEQSIRVGKLLSGLIRSAENKSL